METATRFRNQRTNNPLASNQPQGNGVDEVLRDAQLVVGDERRLSPRRRPVKTLRYVGDVGESTTSQRRASRGNHSTNLINVDQSVDGFEASHIFVEQRRSGHHDRNHSSDIQRLACADPQRNLARPNNNSTGANTVDPSASYAPTKANRNYNLTLKHAW